jgi:hypothetical protein
MAFKAKRLRIQIPCGAGGSIVDLGNLPDIGAACDGGCSDSPQSAVCPPPGPLRPACGVPSNFFGLNPWDEIINPVDQVTLSVDDLPLFRQELQLKMKVLDIADGASSLARQRIEKKLADVASVEKKLTSQSKKTR